MEQRRKPGRPASSDKSKAGEYVGFRSPKELKEKLEQAAQASGRSLSTEVQFRLERSLESQALMYDALELAYGRDLAGLMLGVADVMSGVGEWASLLTTGQHLKNWVANPSAYARAVAEAVRFLEEMRPPGSECDWSKIEVPGQPVLTRALRSGELKPGSDFVQGYIAFLETLNGDVAAGSAVSTNPDALERLRSMLAQVIERRRERIRQEGGADG